MIKLMSSLLVLLMLVVLVGCDEDDETVEPTPALQITAFANDAVDNATLQGAVVTFNVAATTEGTGTIRYAWEVSGGDLHYSTTDKDTVEWTAPEELGNYDVTITAYDGENAASETVTMAVTEYVPTATPYYLGAAACESCHSSTNLPQYTEWTGTKHASALPDLLTSEHVASYCYPCHTVGFKGVGVDETALDGGYDEAMIDSYGGVQCEVCHGPASEHNGDPTKITVAFDGADHCGQCHTGDHHPTMDEWAGTGAYEADGPSPHYYEDPTAAAHGAATRASCAPCHEGSEAAERMDEGSAYVAADPETPYSIGCVTCHDPHSADNEHQLRSLADKALVVNDGANVNTAPIISGGGAGMICVQCHSARRTPVGQDWDGGDRDQIKDGYKYFGPHGNPQADMLFGYSAYEKVNPDWTFRSSGHSKIEETCATCHMYSYEYDSSKDPAAITGHRFEPEVEACEPCHGTITAFSDIMAKADFDGDGSVEGVHNEVEGLVIVLGEKLSDYASVGTDTIPGKNLTYADSVAILITASTDFVTIAENMLHASTGDTSDWAQDMRKPGYNLVFVEDDKSEGIHNPTYAIQLLQQSILFLDPNWSAAAILDDRYASN